MSWEQRVRALEDKVEKLESESTEKEKKGKFLFREFVYDLIYPAMLGSMLYDLVVAADFLNDGMTSQWFVKLAVVCIYLTDWLYIKVADLTDLLDWQKKNAKFVDLLSAAVFLIAFKAADGFVAGQSPSYIIVLGAIFAITVVYFAFHKFSKNNYKIEVPFSLIIGIVLLEAILVLLFSVKPLDDIGQASIGWYTFVTLTLCFGMYALMVILLHIQKHSA